MPDYADVLIAEFDSAGEWPLCREQEHRQKVAKRRAFRRRDKRTLRTIAGWDRFTKNGVERDYLADPLPKLISKSFADFLFGEDPGFTSSAAQDDLDHAIEENRLPSGLHRAERLCSSEGEVWWKLHVNRQIADVALVEWLSRLAVVPLFYGDRVLACAFVSVVARTSEATADGKDEIAVIWRHAEVHTNGRVVNVLYRGGEDTLGKRVPLSQRPETAMLVPEGQDDSADGVTWQHDLPMLAGRIVNEIDDDEGLGESDYDQVEDELLALNEALVIAVENARLTGKDRVYVAGRLLQPDGSFDASIDVMRVEQDGGTLGEGDGKPAIVATEKRYDADPLWTHIGKLTQLVLTRVGLVVQWIGEQIEGGPDSGVAIRLRFLPTVNTATGKARPWDGTLPHILHLLLKVGALAVDQGGFGRRYDSEDLPVVERTDPLPADDTEIVTRNATAVAGEIRSRETAIREQHPEWDDTEVQDELKRIREDTALSTPEPPPPPPPLPDDVPPPPEPAPVPAA